MKFVNSVTKLIRIHTKLQNVCINYCYLTADQAKKKNFMHNAHTIDTEVL